MIALLQDLQSFSLYLLSLAHSLTYSITHTLDQSSMKTMFSLLPTALACLSLGLLGSTAATLCPFDLDADTLQTSVLDSSSPALVAFTQDLDAPTTELMEGAVASLGGLGFCVATFDCADPKHAKTCSITGGNFPFLALYLGEPKMNPYTKKVSLCTP